MKIFALLLLVALAGCVTYPMLETRDGKRIAYDYARGGVEGVILLHMLDGDKSEWSGLTGFLKDAGYSVIAIDFRGHGDSEGDWSKFNDTDFQRFVYDAEAADRFLRGEGVTVKAVIGASIGANVALKLANWKEIRNVILLSPGLSYRNITIMDEAGKFSGNMLVYSGRDDAPAYQAGQVLRRDANATFIVIGGQRHGTEFIPELNYQILDFLNKAD